MYLYIYIYTILYNNYIMLLKIMHSYIQNIKNVYMYKYIHINIHNYK